MYNDSTVTITTNIQSSVANTATYSYRWEYNGSVYTDKDLTVGSFPEGNSTAVLKVTQTVDGINSYNVFEFPFEAEAKPVVGDDWVGGCVVFVNETLGEGYEIKPRFYPGRVPGYLSDSDSVFYVTGLEAYGIPDNSKVTASADNMTGVISLETTEINSYIDNDYATIAINGVPDNMGKSVAFIGGGNVMPESGWFMSVMDSQDSCFLVANDVTLPYMYLDRWGPDPNYSTLYTTVYRNIPCMLKKVDYVPVPR